MSAQTLQPRRRNTRGRPVVQYSRDGRAKLAEYPSARAGQRATGIDLANLWRCAWRRRGYPTAGGFVWRWADDPQHLFREYAASRTIEARNKLVEVFQPTLHMIAEMVHAKLPAE